MNCSTPTGSAAPGGVTSTNASTVNVWPGATGFGEIASVIVVAARPTVIIAGSLALSVKSVASPETKLATIECIPVVRADVVSTALPVASTGAEPIPVPLSRNDTVPVGTDIALIVSVTVAVTVTGSPRTGDAGVGLSVVAVASAAAATGARTARLRPATASDAADRARKRCVRMRLPPSLAAPLSPSWRVSADFLGD